MFEGRTRFTGTSVRSPEMKLALARWIHAVTRKAKLREPNWDRTRAFIGGISLALALSAGVLGAPTAHAAPCIETPVASGTGAATIYTVTFTTVGACDWTAPAGVVSIDVLLVSGGGGGGGGYSDGGGGGGAGAEAKVVAGIGVVSGSSYTVTVGDGGLGGGVYPTPLPGSADNGATGDTSSFRISVSTVQSANGGGGGSPGGVTTGRGGNGGDRGASGGTTTDSSGGGGAGMSGAGSAATSGSGGSGSAGAVAASRSGLFSGWADVYGGGGGGGAGAGAGAAGAGGSGGGASGGVGVDGLSGTSNTGGGGGGGGDGRPGGQGGSGIVVIKYQVASVSPSTLTVNATVGQAITPTTFVLYGVGATTLNQWCESTPGTYDGTSATYELVPGVTLDESTCVLSGTPSAAASTAAFVIGGGGSATVPAGGRSTVTLTVSAGGGGSGGGGGSSSTPEPTPTPTPAPTPSTVATTPPVMGPIPPGSNPNIPTSGVPLGASVYLVNGEPQTVVVRPDAPKDATAIDVVGDGFTMKLAGLGGNGQPLGVTSDGALILQSDRTAAVEGTGFLPNSDVNLYTFSTPRFLGTVKTDASGNFKGTVPLPTDIPAGRHTLQSNGLAPDGAVRSLSLGVLLTADKARAKARTAKATVYFNALSPALTSSAKDSLKALVKGRAASATRTLVVGYVQDSGLASNNQTLSAQRAKTIAAYLRSLGLKGTVVTQGDGVAKESGAAGRKAEVTIRYRR